MDVAPVDRDYNTINDALTSLITSARMDSAGNLQNKNVLMEGFYREFLNILYGWKLVNANSEQQNMPKIDLIDRENKIVAQVSATCDHGKIQDSLDGFEPPEDGEWHFVFIPITTNAPKLRSGFDLPARMAFDYKRDILYPTRLMRMVQHAGAEKQFLLAQFVSLKKVFLWKRLNELLQETRKEHPSFVLMAPDELDKQLYPHIKDAPALLDAYGKNSEGEVCPIWEIIRASWRKAENHPIVIEGAGGIGKTVALFSIADAEDRYCPAPAVYVPMHRLVTQDGHCVNLSDYIRKQSDTYGQKVVELAEKPWDGGPQLLVLLDGFNEVPALKQREILNMLNKWRCGHPGAQLIAVSRPLDQVILKEELKGNPIAIELEPLKLEVIRERLEKFGVKPPAIGAKTWETLRLPLFLNLYIKTDRLAEQTADGYPLAVKPPENAGALIWNYLQRELLRQKEEENNEAWVMRCAIACEYILPYIAFHMERKHHFSLELEEGEDLIKKAVASIDMEKLPHHLLALSKRYRRLKHKFYDLSEIDWNITVLDDVGLLKEENDSYAFVHQHFRDAFAGLYLVNQAEMMLDREELPEVWRRAANYDVMNYAAELMEEPEAARLWETNRLMRPTDSSATYAMLELQMRRSDGSDSKLDFSGMDLSNISLVRYMRDGTQGEKDMKLFRRPELSVQARLDKETFRSQGHTEWVRCVAVAENGLGVSGSFDNTLRVWDLRTGECLRVLKGHTGSVECVAVTEDGLCVSGSFDNTLRVWDLRTGECLRVLKGHTNSVKCVAVTEDELCVSGSDDDTLQVWDLRTGECLRVLKGHTGSVECVAVTEDGLCVSGSGDKTLRVWDLHTGECLRALKGHTVSVNGVAVTEDGLCVSGSGDRTLRVWDLCTGECRRVLEGHTDWVNCVAVTEDGLCVSGSHDDTLRVWDQRTGECRRVLEGHITRVNCVAVAEGGLCVSGSLDGTLRVWDQRTGECLRVLKGHTNWVNCFTMTEDGLCVSGSLDGTLWVWDQRAGEWLCVLKGYTLPVNCVTMSKDGLCVSGSFGNTLRVWDLRTGECLRVLKGHTKSVNCVAVTEDGLCVSGANDDTLRVWDMHTGECLRVLKGHTDSVNCVAVTEDGLCVSGSGDRTLRVWDLRAGECLRVLKGHTGLVGCVAVTEDGLCVSGSHDDTLRVWDLRTGECLHVLKGHAISVNCVAVTEDGLAVSGSYDDTLRVWDLRAGECLHVLEGHAGLINGVAVLKDGRCISGSSDGTLRARDIHTGKCLDIWYTMETDVSQMDFSMANLTPTLSKTLWKNRAKIPEADSAKYARREPDEV